MITIALYSILSLATSNDSDQLGDFENEESIDRLLELNEEFQVEVQSLPFSKFCAQPPDLLEATLECRAKARRNCREIGIRRLRRVCEGAVMSACLAERLFTCMRESSN